MRYHRFFLLFLAISSNLLAEELTNIQCEAIGGTYTKAGCLILDESEKAKYKSENTYLPDKEECECQGGTWHAEYGCMAKVSKEQCASLGGKIQPEIGCVQQFTQEKCQELGGSLNENGGCVLKPQPNPAFERDAAKARRPSTLR